MRLWLLDQVQELESALKAVISVIVERADKERSILMPGYTHLQVTTFDSHICRLLRTTAEGSTHSLVTSHPLSWILTSFRPATAPATRAPRFGSPVGFRTSCREPLLGRPGLLGQRTRLSNGGREQHVGRRRSRLRRRVPDVVESLHGSFEQTRGRLDCLFHIRIRIHHPQRCVQVSSHDVYDP